MATDIYLYIYVTRMEPTTAVSSLLHVMPRCFCSHMHLQYFTCFSLYETLGLMHEGSSSYKECGERGGEAPLRRKAQVSNEKARVPCSGER